MSQSDPLVAKRPTLPRGWRYLDSLPAEFRPHRFDVTCYEVPPVLMHVEASTHPYWEEISKVFWFSGRPLPRHLDYLEWFELLVFTDEQWGEEQISAICLAPARYPQLPLSFLEVNPATRLELHMNVLMRRDYMIPTPECILKYFNQVSWEFERQAKSPYQSE